MKIYVLAYIINFFICTYFYYSCDACGSGYCTVEQWAPWGSCNASCGRGVQERQKAICCDTFKYHSLKACLNSCNIPVSWWQANAVEHKQCGQCQRGGTFDINQNTCICPSGYGGSCCDLQTTLPTTTKTSTTTTKPTTTKTTTRSTTTKTTTKPTTTKTTKPTTKKTTTKTTTVKQTNKPTTTESTTIPTVTKTTTIPTTTEATTKPTTTKTTRPTTTEATTKITTLKTTSKLTTTRTITIPTTTKTIQPWAIAVISVSCLGIVSTCCFCLWWHVRSYMRKNRVTKIKPAEEQSC
ncbi:platelet glycoprotein Ib alpha chain-like [Mytilus edulis]|uniref:platelet glycoprotein Ib alpha chain-like n=1 Tax=Mytilus edulis TaxID=6550 RepID=UPI0039EE00F9